MPRQPLSRLSLTQLRELTGRGERTIRDALEDLEPVAEDGRTRWYDASAALSRIYCGGRPVGGGRRDLARGLLRSMILPEAEWLPWRSRSLVPVRAYFAELGIGDERERAALHSIGFPIVAPAKGETEARTSPELAERWLTMLSLVLETLGGDGAIKANLGAELLRLESGYALDDVLHGRARPA